MLANWHEALSVVVEQPKFSSARRSPIYLRHKANLPAPLPGSLIILSLQRRLDTESTVFCLL